MATMSAPRVPTAVSMSEFTQRGMRLASHTRARFSIPLMKEVWMRCAWFMCVSAVLGLDR